MSGPDLEHARLLAEGRFSAQQCLACLRRVFPPRTLCPHCGASSLEFSSLSGLGTVYSTTVVRARPDEGGPYNLALIDLDEGFRMMSRVESLLPEEVTIGQRVRARISRPSGPDQVALVVFDPA